MSTLIKKITVKHVCGSIPAIAVGEEKNICVILGYAKSSEIKNTTYGDSVAFHGDFKAINSDTGESFRAGTCYLPDVAESLLDNALQSSGGAVEFGFAISVIGVKGRNDSETGKYEYRCKPLMQTSENDPLMLLENKLRAETEQPSSGTKKGKK